GRQLLEPRIFLRGVDVDERAQLRVEPAEFLDFDDARPDLTEESGVAVTARGASPEGLQAGRRVDGMEGFVFSAVPGNHHVHPLGERAEVTNERGVEERHIAAAYERRPTRVEDPRVDARERPVP